MKKIVLVLAASCLLASCGGSETRSEQPSAPVAKMVAKTGKYDNDIVKVCDEGRAIYSIRDDNSASLAIVENARECQR